MLPATSRRLAPVQGGRGTDAWRRESGERGGGRRSYETRWKRVFDATVAAGLLLLTLPLIGVLALLVATDGGRPVFAHPRVGRDGRLFPCVKLRTMVVDADARLARLLAEDPAAAEEWARDRKLRRDPRVTWIGRVLRCTSLDELPQLWNVLRGDMSLVGPRPVTPEEIVLYGPSARSYVRVRPGLTGPWQVSGRNEVSFAERVELDRAYADRPSFAGDVSILLRTVPAVLRVTGC